MFEAGLMETALTATEETVPVAVPDPVVDPVLAPVVAPMVDPVPVEVLVGAEDEPTVSVAPPPPPPHEPDKTAITGITIQRTKYDMVITFMLPQTLLARVLKCYRIKLEVSGVQKLTTPRRRDLVNDSQRRSTSQIAPNKATAIATQINLRPGAGAAT